MAKTHGNRGKVGRKTVDNNRTTDDRHSSLRLLCVDTASPDGVSLRRTKVVPSGGLFMTSQQIFHCNTLANLALDLLSQLMRKSYAVEMNRQL